MGEGKQAMKLDTCTHMLLCVNMLDGKKRPQGRVSLLMRSLAGHFIFYLVLVQPRKAGMPEKLLTGM